MKILRFFKGVTSENVDGLIAEIEHALSVNSAETFELYIGSTGGSPEAAMAFLDYVHDREIQVDTIGIGLVASAAVYMFMAGRRRKIGPHVQFYFHQMSRTAKKDESMSIARLEALVNDMRSVTRLGHSILLAKTKLNEEALARLEAEETTLFADEVLRLGIAHEIVGGP